MVNCTSKPSYISRNGALMFNTKKVCEGYPDGCGDDCPDKNDPSRDYTEKRLKQ